MSLDKILQALEAEAAQEIAEIERAADREIAHVRADAEEKAAAARHKHAPSLAAPLHAECARILNQAKLEALRTLMGTREELMRVAVETAAAELAALPQNGAYARALENLTCEAAVALGQEGGLLLRVESRDRALMTEIIEQNHLEATVTDGATVDETGWDCPGGVLATTSDGRITLDNTLSARLQRVTALHRSAIAGMLFDETRQAGGPPGVPGA